MSILLDPFRFLLVTVAGWMNQHQLQVIDYLREENRVLREQLGDKRLRFRDDQRRRLAAKAKGLGRKLLAEVATIVAPETLLAYGPKTQFLPFSAISGIEWRLYEASYATGRLWPETLSGVEAESVGVRNWAVHSEYSE